MPEPVTGPTRPLPRGGRQRTTPRRGPGAAHAGSGRRERIRRGSGPPCPLRHQKQRLSFLVEGREGSRVTRSSRRATSVCDCSPGHRGRVNSSRTPCASREIPDEAAEEVLARFEDVGLIDDAAFAGSCVESRHHGRGLARRALVRELRTKGVDSAVIDEAVGQLDPDQEEETARELVARKLRSTRGLDRDKRLRRLAGMLARKGYGRAWPCGWCVRRWRRRARTRRAWTSLSDYRSLTWVVRRRCGPVRRYCPARDARRMVASRRARASAAVRPGWRFHGPISPGHPARAAP